MRLSHVQRRDSFQLNVLCKKEKKADSSTQLSPEPKVKVIIPVYESFETAKCKTCGSIIAEKRIIGTK